MKQIIIPVLIILLFLVQNGSAETASDSYISIGIDIPEYVSQNESFLVNISAVEESVYPYVNGSLYIETELLDWYSIWFLSSNYWNKTVEAIFNGGVGGIEWYLPSKNDSRSGQTIPIKFRAHKVTHTLYFKVIYWPAGCNCHTLNVLIVGDNVTATPVYDPSVLVKISSGTSDVFEAIPGKGVDYIRFSNGNQQYMVNWDTSGSPPGEYNIKVSFDNGYEKETKILLI